MGTGSGLLWIGFAVVIAGMMALDMGVFHRKAHTVSIKEAAVWAGVWVGLALLFNLGVLYFRGSEKALEFLTGYIIEESLSVDNLFVFMVIFNFFSLPSSLYHTVLLWGIIGAIVLRGIMIFIGIALISRFEWILYVFGAILIYTAVKLILQKKEQVEPGRNIVVRIARKIWPVTDEYSGKRFFTRTLDGRLAATPLLVVLLAVESTDVLFAVDSIPAIFAVTRDPFIIFTSNIFAVMGLRSIFFFIVGIIHKFRFLRAGLSLVLGFIGLKMLMEGLFHVPITISLVVVALILAATMILSLIFPEKKTGFPSPPGS